jgi:hypothetical protein
VLAAERMIKDNDGFMDFHIRLDTHTIENRNCQQTFSFLLKRAIFDAGFVDKHGNIRVPGKGLMPRVIV